MFFLHFVHWFALGSGIVMDWEQTSGSLYTSGDVRFVRIWDVQTELRVQVRQCMWKINGNVFCESPSKNICKELIIPDVRGGFCVWSLSHFLDSDVNNLGAMIFVWSTTHAWLTLLRLLLTKV